MLNCQTIPQFSLRSNKPVKTDNNNISQAYLNTGFPIRSRRLKLLICDNETQTLLDTIALDRRISANYVLRPLVNDFGLGYSVPDFNICVAAQLGEDGPMIGRVEMIANRIGFFIDPDYWGCGYGTEMIGLSCDVFSRLSRLSSIYATVLRDNYASLRILRNCGFNFCGLTRECYLRGIGRTVFIFRRDCKYY